MIARRPLCQGPAVARMSFRGPLFLGCLSVLLGCRICPTVRQSDRTGAGFFHGFLPVASIAPTRRTPKRPNSAEKGRSGYADARCPADRQRLETVHFSAVFGIGADGRSPAARFGSMPSSIPATSRRSFHTTAAERRLCFLRCSAEPFLGVRPVPKPPAKPSHRVLFPGPSSLHKNGRH